MNLEIIDFDGDQVFWNLDGEDGCCDIVDGKVFSTYLCDGPFDMRPGVPQTIAAEVLRWLRTEFNKSI